MSVVSAWRNYRTGEVVFSCRLPADPGLMGCGLSGPSAVISDRGIPAETWTVCIDRAGHEGEHRFRPLGLLEPTRAPGPLAGGGIG